MKIGFCGTMSVGKTTLVNALKEREEFKGYEFATERSKYLRDMGIPLNTDSTLKGQVIFLAERCSELYIENVVTDRTVIDVMAFTNVARSIPYFQADQYKELASHMLKEYDYIFYISPEGVPMEDNGVRETNLKFRKKVDREIKDLLDYYNHRLRNVTELTGSVEERVEKVIQTVFPQYL